MQKWSFTLLLLLVITLIQAQSPIGIWKNIDESDGIVKSHIEIYESDGQLYGKVIKLLPAATITHCHKCKGDFKDASLLNMIILKDLKPKSNYWDGGKILDPGNGKEYRCKISLADANTLNVRGYIGKPIFGRTQKWYRVI